METFWFAALALMLALYIVLDGFDLGAGMCHLFVARTDAERRMVLRSIGPVWDGNEVWLVAGGATLLLAFPKAFSAAFSGFYLPLIMILWMLMLRALAIELRNKFEGAIWRPTWDVVFAGSSLALVILFGAALGNVVRGVPFQEDTGGFFTPLWTHFGVRGNVGILDGYTILVAVTAVVALLVHGAAWIAWKTEGDPALRSRTVVRRTLPVLAVLIAFLTVVTLYVQPHVRERIFTNPAGWALPVLAIAGLGLALRSARSAHDRATFLSSAALLFGLFGSAAFGLYPYLLPSSTGPELALTAASSAAPAYGLRVALYWWIPGMLLASSYFVIVYRSFAGRVSLDDAQG